VVYCLIIIIIIIIIIKQHYYIFYIKAGLHTDRLAESFRKLIVSYQMRSTVVEYGDMCQTVRCFEKSLQNVMK
jgi:hypothetical protein